MTTSTAEHLLNEFLETHHIGSVDEDHPDNQNGEAEPAFVPPDVDTELEDD